MRVAAIDVGTNTVTLLIADAGEDGALTAVVEDEAMPRLGEGVDRARAIAADAAARTLACLERFARTIDASACDAVDVVGTSALRDAAGGEAFAARARAILGHELRVLSGRDEAVAAFSGATTDARAPGPRVVFDIGAGSTEIAVGDGSTGAVSFAASLDIGSVRLTERVLASDPPAARELSAMNAAIDAALGALPALPDTTLAPIGVAGTMTTLASLALDYARYDARRAHGAVVSAHAIASLAERLAALTVAERASLAAMAPGRADVLVAGAAIARAIVSRLGAASVQISDRGVRWGLARALVERVRRT